MSSEDTEVAGRAGRIRQRMPLLAEVDAFSLILFSEEVIDISIECFVVVSEIYWCVVPCTGAGRHVTCWVTDHDLVTFARDKRIEPYGWGSLQVRSTLFVRVLRRAIEEEGEFDLGGRGTFRSQGERITFTTSCGETRHFTVADLDALLNWLDPPPDLDALLGSAEEPAEVTT